MKKSIIAIILCLAAMLSLAACGSAAAASETVEEAVGADPATWGPTEHNTLASAEADAGIELSIPDEILGSKPTVFLTWYERAYIDAVYTDDDGNNTARVRKAAGREDNISGDYTNYSESATEQIDGMSVAVKGENGKVMVASWTDSGNSFCLTADAGLTVDELTALIAEVK